MRPRAPVRREDFLGFRGGIDVAVREHGTGQRLDRAGDEFVAGHAAIHLLHRARVDGEQVERMPREDRQQFVEDVRVVEADPRLHGERDRDRLAQCAEDLDRFAAGSRSSPPPAHLR